LRFPPAQADRQGRAADFAAAYAKSELKVAADEEIERQMATASDLGACVGRVCVYAGVRVGVEIVHAACHVDAAFA